MNRSEIMPSSPGTENYLGSSYLKFQINRQTAAVLSMRHIQEAMIVPVESVTSMPNMPDCFLGLMNWRSRVIWAIDLLRMLNLEPIDNRLREYNVIVLRLESLLLGLVVQEIKGTTKFNADDICSPVGQVAASLIPYLSGCVWQQQETLLVLNAQTIVQSPILRSD
jgi:twitching motility protein PilI